MKRSHFIILFLFVLITGCGQNATVEVGFNDGALLTAIYGDMVIRVTKIEVLLNGEYTTLWDDKNIVSVTVNSDDFCSITQNYVSITPDSYKKFRITIDSLCYKIDDNIIQLIDSVYQFTATAFTDIIIENNDQFQLVIGIATNNWFDTDSMQIKPGHMPFEGANLKINY